MTAGSNIEEANKKLYNKDRVESFNVKANRLVAKFMTSCVLQYDHSKSSEQVVDRKLFVDAEKELDADSPEVSDVNSFWDAETTTVLDFGCGAGNISLVLKPYVHKVFGVDISEDMIEAYKERTGFDGYACNVAEDPIPPLEGVQFDAIVTTLAYHHVEDYQLVTHKLVKYLKPGGWLYVVDFDSTNQYGSLEHCLLIHGLGHSDRDDKNRRQEVLDQLGTAHTHGFGPEIAIKTLENAGFTNVGVDSHLDVRVFPTVEEFQTMSGQSGDFARFPRDSTGRCELSHGLLLVVGQKPLN